MLKAYSSNKYYQQKKFTIQLNKRIMDIANTILSYITNKKYSCIAEIASDQGDLLRALHKEVDYIYSIDPSPISNSIKDIDNTEHVQTFFNYNSMKNRITRKIDLIICRHVIEHMNNLGESLKDIIKLLDEDGIIYIEVPDIEEIIKHNRFYEIYHDYYGYFQQNTLINIMREFGCEFLNRVTYFNGQHQGLFFKKNKLKAHKQSKKDYNLYDNLVGNNFLHAIDKINSMLENYNSIGIYGAGVHTNTFINLLSKSNLKKINKAFDANKDKWNKFLQNADIQICNPSIKNLQNIDCLVMIMPICKDLVYNNEILEFIKSGFDAKILKTIDCSIYKEV